MNHDDDQLTDERIAAMRAHVMTRTRPASRRGSFVWGAVAATLAFTVLGSVGFAVMNLGEGPTGSSDSAMSSEIYETAPGVQAQDSDESSDLAEVEREASNGEDDHVITSGHATISVSKSGTAAQDIRTEVDRLGGRIDHDSRQHDDVETVSMTVRVPGDKVDEFTTFLHGLGTVTESSVDRVHVDQQVRDLEARITALTVSTKRLQSIMEKATSTRELLDAEQQLAQRQGELESLTAERRALADQTAMATLDLTLTEGTSKSAVDPGGFRGGLVQGWNTLVTVINGLVEAVGFALPWLVPIAIIVFAVRWWWRRRT